MLAFKDGVRLSLRAPVIRYLLEALDAVSELEEVTAALSPGTLLTVTSGHDGVHLANSRHYRNEALDLRTHNLRWDTRPTIRKLIEDELNRPWGRRLFTVLHEALNQPHEHFHIQVGIGQTFPLDLPTTLRARAEAPVEPGASSASATPVAPRIDALT